MYVRFIGGGISTIPETVLKRPRACAAVSNARSPSFRYFPLGLQAPANLLS